MRIARLALAAAAASVPFWAQSSLAAINSPADLPGNTIWYDAQDLSTITQDNLSGLGNTSGPSTTITAATTANPSGISIRTWKNKGTLGSKADLVRATNVGPQLVNTSTAAANFGFSGTKANTNAVFFNNLTGSASSISNLMVTGSYDPTRFTPSGQPALNAPYNQPTVGRTLEGSAFSADGFGNTTFLVLKQFADKDVSTGANAPAGSTGTNNPNNAVTNTPQTNRRSLFGWESSSRRKGFGTTSIGSGNDLGLSRFQLGGLVGNTTTSLTANNATSTVMGNGPAGLVTAASVGSTYSQAVDVNNTISVNYVGSQIVGPTGGVAGADLTGGNVGILSIARSTSANSISTITAPGGVNTPVTSTTVTSVSQVAGALSYDQNDANVDASQPGNAGKLFTSFDSSSRPDVVNGNGDTVSAPLTSVFYLGGIPSNTGAGPTPANQNFSTGLVQAVGSYYLSEMIIFNRTLTAAEYADVSDYLANKYFVVPEPASISLLGGVGLLAIRRRRKSV